MTRGIPIRLAGIVVLGAVVIALAGCGIVGDRDADPTLAPPGSSSATPSATPSGPRQNRVLTAAEAGAVLPSVRDLPSGWKLTAESPTPSASPTEAKDVVNPASCQQFWDQGPDASPDETDGRLAAQAQVQFDANDDRFRQLYFYVESWKDVDDAASPVRLVYQVAKCSHFTVTDSDGTNPVTAKVLTTPELGDTQAGAQLTLTISGTKFYVSIWYFQVGHNVVSAVYTSTTQNEDLESIYRPVVALMIGRLSE